MYRNANLKSAEVKKARELIEKLLPLPYKREDFEKLSAEDRQKVVEAEAVLRLDYEKYCEENGIISELVLPEVKTGESEKLIVVSSRMETPVFSALQACSMDYRGDKHSSQVNAYLSQFVAAALLKWRENQALEKLYEVYDGQCRVMAAAYCTKPDFACSKSLEPIGENIRYGLGLLEVQTVNIGLQFFELKEEDLPHIDFYIFPERDLDSYISNPDTYKKLKETQYCICL